MNKKIKIIISAISLLTVLMLIYPTVRSIDQIDVYAPYLGLDSDNGTVFVCVRLFWQCLFTIIGFFITLILLTYINFLMWFKNFFGVPLTPEQAAERKRIIAERKKAKLQEKLNKLN